MKTLESIASQLPEDTAASIRMQILQVEAGAPHSPAAAEQQAPGRPGAAAAASRAPTMTWETHELVATDAVEQSKSPCAGAVEQLSRAESSRVEQSRAE